MSVVAYTGLPRSGKSYSVTQYVLLPAFKTGRKIITNIPLNKSEILKQYPNANFQIFDNREPIDDPLFWENIEAGALIVIDECWRYWASGIKACDFPESQREFFAMHGHKVGLNGLTQQIVLVTQDLSQVATIARLLVEETFRTTKLNAIGMNNRYRVDIYTGAQTGQNIPTSLRVRELTGTYKSSIYKYYKSHTMSETGTAGDESKMDNRGNLLKSFRIKAIILFIIIAPIFSYILFSNFAESYTEPAVKRPLRTVTKTVPVQKTLKINKAESKKLKLNLSNRWRIIGTITNKKQRKAIIKSGSIVRMIDLEDYCKQTNVTTGYECIVENEYITEYSGFIDEIDINPITISETKEKIQNIKRGRAASDINRNNFTVIGSEERWPHKAASATGWAKKPD